MLLIIMAKTMIIVIMEELVTIKIITVIVINYRGTPWKKHT